MKKTLWIWAISFWAILAVTLGSAIAAETKATSPNGEIEVVISDDRGIPTYKASFRGNVVISSSRLGMRFARSAGLDEGLTLAKTESSSHDQTWEQPWGERRFVRENYNEVFVEFVSANSPDRRIGVRFRVFDDGLGFRYEIPKSKTLKADAVTSELTEFTVSEKSRVWWIPARYWNRYEYLYRESGANEELTSHTPMTVKTPSGAYLSFHEAALVDYAGMSLRQIRPGKFKADLAPWSDGALVKFDAPF